MCVVDSRSVPLLSPTPQHALEQEMKRNAEAVNETISPQAQKAYLDTLADSLSLPSKPRNPLRVDDVVRKNEVSGGRGERAGREMRR